MSLTRDGMEWWYRNESHETSCWWLDDDMGAISLRRVQCGRRPAATGTGSARACQDLPPPTLSRLQKVLTSTSVAAGGSEPSEQRKAAPAAQPGLHRSGDENKPKPAFSTGTAGCLGPTCLAWDISISCNGFDHDGRPDPKGQRPVVDLWPVG